MYSHQNCKTANSEEALLKKNNKLENSVFQLQIQ
jgi:hypothetical protein